MKLKRSAVLLLNQLEYVRGFANKGMSEMYYYYIIWLSRRTILYINLVEKINSTFKMEVQLETLRFALCIISLLLSVNVLLLFL